MTRICSRCATVNSRWEARCKACWLPFDAGAPVRPDEPAEQPAKRRPSARTTAAATAATAAAVAAASVTPPAPEQHRALAELLGVEVAHVRALAEAGIHTLEHVAQAAPGEIGLALRAWTHIDPGALIVLARRLLHHEKAGAEPPAPNPAEWWKNP
jgi:hypothetical protein